MWADTQNNTLLLKFWKVGRNDLLPQFKNIPIEDFSLNNFAIPATVIHSISLIIFVDENTGKTKILKNRWGTIGKVEEEPEK